MSVEPWPLPYVDETNEFFWNGVATGKLLFQRCTGCATVRYPPGLVCHACSSDSWEVFESSGRGRVHSYAIARRPVVPFLEPDTVHVVVELEHGVRMLSLVVPDDVDAVEFDAPVEVRFRRVGPEHGIPVFALVDSREDDA